MEKTEKFHLDMKEILLAFHGKTIERIMLLFVRRIKANLSNGKLERLWDEYDKYRFSFNSMDEFILWYNDSFLLRMLGLFMK